MICIETIDSHTAGEGTRLVTAGLPPLLGATMAEKLAFARQTMPEAPARLLCEPHGHKDLYGAILTPACRAEADIGLVFMNNHGYEPMCGHAVIGAITSLVETGKLSATAPQTVVRLDTAAGLIQCFAATDGVRVHSVAFTNVPSFAYQLDVPLPIPDFPDLSVDLAYGGNFFVLVEASQLGLEVCRENAARFVPLGMSILEQANRQVNVRHPAQPAGDRILDVRFYQDNPALGAHSRNIVILGDRMIDRSPCGTGTSAELAVRFARGQIKIGELFIAEGILGTRFKGMVVTRVDEPQGNIPYPVIVPLIEGQAFLTGINQLIFQPDDPFPNGFVIGT